jgi:hypothetical protein
MICIDLRSQDDIFDMQNDCWQFAHKIFSDKDRIKAIEAFQSGKEKDVSLLFWEGTEYLCKAIVGKITPIVCFKLTNSKFKIPYPPRERLCND